MVGNGVDLPSLPKGDEKLVENTKKYKLGAQYGYIFIVDLFSGISNVLKSRQEIALKAAPMKR